MPFPGDSENVRNGFRVDPPDLVSQPPDPSSAEPWKGAGIVARPHLQNWIDPESRYRDFRRMLDELDEQIDAVVVSTPDHPHAVAAMAAMRQGKHVYCEKPLAHSVAEVRALAEAARRQKVITQMGNQGHSFESIRQFCEWTRATTATISGARAPSYLATGEGFATGRTARPG